MSSLNIVTKISIGSPSSSTDTLSSSLNVLEQAEVKDVEELSLLHQIFPDENTQSLKKIHQERLRRSSNLSPWVWQPEKNCPRSTLGKRIWKETIHIIQTKNYEGEEEQFQLQWQEAILTKVFLRLPSNIVVERGNRKLGCREYQFVEDMEYICTRQNEKHFPSHWPLDQQYTRVIFRDPKLGLGMTIKEESGFVQIHALADRNESHFKNSPISKKSDGPSLHSDINPGDIILGINGSGILGSKSITKSLIRVVVSKIQASPDPVVLHLIKANSVRILLTSLQDCTTSLLDKTIGLAEESIISNQSTEPKKLRAGKISLLHPLDQALASRKLISSKKEVITERLIQYTERARHWENFSAFLVDSHTLKLLNNYYAETAAEYFLDHSGRTYQIGLQSHPPSTPMNELSQPSTRNELNFSNPDLGRNNQHLSRNNKTSVFIPLCGIRKALSIRILNLFLDGDRTAYTIWIYDVESSREWYAPIRYFRDFQDLRLATQEIYPAIGNISFPSLGWTVFGNREASESNEVRRTKCQQLEHFLRSLCGLIYTGKMHPNVAEVAIHVQSFLGYESNLGDLDLDAQFQRTEMCTLSTIGGVHHDNEQMKARALLQKGLHIYIYRLFLLDIMREIVNRFVDAARTRGSKSNETNSLESRSRVLLKELAMQELEQLQSFLDQLQELIIEGCMDDFRLIAKHRQFTAIHHYIFQDTNCDSYWDRLVRDAVRKQVEIEVYVPLRSIISRLLVNGWRHEDMEVQFKIQELRRRPQSFFRIQSEKLSSSNWHSVSLILKHGTSLSTLPCTKLHSIVDAAIEITKLYINEHNASNNDKYGKKCIETEKDGQSCHLGADDFLPIFIFCVIQADMERPCALCVLLRSLCDPINRIGEIGYYLASFEAAITHIQEIDLAEDREEMLSFLSVALSEESLEE